MAVSATNPWARYASAFKGTQARVFAGAMLSVLTGLASVPIPLLVGYAFDRVIPFGRTDRLVQVGLAILGLQLLNGIFALWTRHVILGVTKQVSAGLRRDSVARLLAAPRSFYTSRGLAAPHDLVVHDNERVDVMSNVLLSEVGPAVVMSLGVCSVLLWLNATLLLAMMMVIPLNVIAARWLGKEMRARIAAFHGSYTRFSRSILFLIRAIDLTRVQTAEPFETKQLSDRIDDLRATSTRMAWSGSLYTVLQQNLVAAAGVVVLVLGGWMAANGRMSVGRLLSFFAGLMLLRGSMHILLAGLPRLMEGVASLRRLMPFLDGDEQEPYQGTERIPFTGAVVLRDVSFSYGSTPVLSSVTLNLEPGSVLALVGPNGSGKSTIVNLILGFYRPESGAVYADGRPYDSLDLRNLRGAIGVVAQDALLVPGTIRDNLLYGAPDTPFTDVLDACQLAGVDAFIQRLPQGYDSPVGEDGSLLSGGQRQRLALARALVGKPKLVILDEPMNHLDETDSVEFLSRLTQAPHRPAILLISHRRDGLSVADRLVRLERGRLVDMAETAAR